jgi:predicted lipid-binding transport protein (Tim44 family)
MSKTLQLIVTGLVGGLVGGIIDVIVGKVGAAIVIFGVIIIVGGIAGYFINKSR